MNDDQLIIKNSKETQYLGVLVPVIMILAYFAGLFENPRILYSKYPTFTIILGIIMFTLFIYFLNEVIKRKAEIILTKEGIELRNKGFYSWQFVESFETDYFRVSTHTNENLILHFRGFADIQFDISSLEKNRLELIESILKYKGSANVFYLGHNIGKEINSIDDVN
jgi:hypothetical protein